MENTLKKISKHIIEIRFQPYARFLDDRGMIADNLTSSSKLFKRWNISSNRIDFTSDENLHIRAFFSYMNFGLISIYPNATAFFIESAEDFIKSAWTTYLNNMKFLRIGVRSMLLIETDDFKSAMDAYRKHFLKLSDEDIKNIGGDLIDVGFPMNFVDNENYFNVVTGPMKKEQSKQFFGEIELPPIGIFVDIDYFRKDFYPDTKQKISQKLLLDFLKNGIEKAEGITTLIFNLVSNRR